ncbi:hypothetical protein [Pseudomonas sp. H9]|uniref:hypothetical protein n=1 Tax=Pseudomonas sp. H9 TaxID=483968 RepID=UPI001057FEB6|nr:hypothetical protein [Pseudomonas sp. H9]TDF78362.1 hypothetical protein E1573_23885 [Pseudomonas sp. H9]
MKGMASSTLMAIVEDHSRSYELRMNEADHARLPLVERYLRIQQELIDYLSPIVAHTFRPVSGAQATMAQRMNASRAEHERLRKLLAEQERDIAQALRSSREVRTQRDEIDRQAQARLERSPEYQRASQHLQHALAAEQQAEADYAEVLAECTAKLPQYQVHPIYTFLRHRHYGMAEYRGGRVARVLDDWLAKRVNFRSNLENERTLWEMQHYNETLRSERQANLEALQQSMYDLQDEAQRTAGKEALNIKQKLLTRQLFAAKQRAKELQAERLPLITNEDPDFQAGLQLISEQTGGKSMKDVLEELTPVLASNPQAGARLQALCTEHQNILQELDNCYEQQLAADDAFALAKDLEIELRHYLFGDVECDEDCDCECHCTPHLHGCSDESCNVQDCNCSCHQECVCGYNYDSGEYFNASLDVAQLLSSYMKRDITLDYLLGLLDAQFLPDDETTPYLHSSATGCATS